MSGARRFALLSIAAALVDDCAEGAGVVDHGLGRPALRRARGHDQSRRGAGAAGDARDRRAPARRGARLRLLQGRVFFERHRGHADPAGGRRHRLDGGRAAHLAAAPGKRGRRARRVRDRVARQFRGRAAAAGCRPALSLHRARGGRAAPHDGRVDFRRHHRGRRRRLGHGLGAARSPDRARGGREYRVVGRAARAALRRRACSTTRCPRRSCRR